MGSQPPSPEGPGSGNEIIKDVAKETPIEDQSRVAYLLEERLRIHDKTRRVCYVRISDPHPLHYTEASESNLKTYEYKILIKYATQARELADFESLVLLQTCLIRRNDAHVSNSKYLAVALESRAEQLEKMGQLERAIALVNRAIEIRGSLPTKATRAGLAQWDSERNLDCLIRLHGKRRTMLENIEIIKLHPCGSAYSDPASSKELWPDKFGDLDESRIPECPLERLVRYTDQILYVAKCNSDMLLPLAEEIARRLPLIYKNLWICCKAYRARKETVNEIKMRLRMMELKPGDNGNTEHIERLLGRLEENERAPFAEQFMSLYGAHMDARVQT